MVGWSCRGAWTVVAGMLAVVLVASGPVSTDRPAHDGGTGPLRTTLRVLQMNLCDSGSAACYSGRSVAQAGAVIRAEVPDVVTLNEVCRDDVAALAAALAGDAGGIVTAFQAAWDRRTGAALRCRNGLPYGIGLITRLPGLARGHDTIGGAYPEQDARTVEERAWLCLRQTAGAAPDAVTVCTTHLTNTDTAVARAQCAYLLDTAIPAVRDPGAAPVVVAGDLNLRSPDVRTCDPGGRRADDGVVQHVVTTAGLAVGARRLITLSATDHPGLLVTLIRAARDVPDVRAAR